MRREIQEFGFRRVHIAQPGDVEVERCGRLGHKPRQAMVDRRTIAFERTNEPGPGLAVDNDGLGKGITRLGDLAVGARVGQRMGWRQDGGDRQAGGVRAVNEGGHGIVQGQ